MDSLAALPHVPAGTKTMIDVRWWRIPGCGARWARPDDPRSSSQITRRPRFSRRYAGLPLPNARVRAEQVERLPAGGCDVAVAAASCWNGSRSALTGEPGGVVIQVEGAEEHVLPEERRGRYHR